ncbi:uncharacterized protein LOC126325912 isoform X2 [Schistocerca gregaria]|uniref:uncharacterized protein LOC126325912 isoform X2 n=1 Tax=Schistocerca gregaria TaxID=7010 RepID=UPI00211F3FC7|nr:uncharacterized protein LOC126325912 isoform X2 [Schistocerca gregaria]
MMSKKEVKSFAEGSVAKHHTIEWCPPCFGAMEENSAVCRAVADEYESNVPDDEKHVVSRTIHLPDIEYNRGGRVVDGGCKEERVVKAAKYRVKKTRHKESTTSTVNEGGTFLNANTRPQSGDTYYGRRASENSSSHASQTVYTNTHTKKDVCTNRSANRLDHRASRQAKCADTSTHKSAELSQGTASLTAHLGSSHQRQHVSTEHAENKPKGRKDMFSQDTDSSFQTARMSRTTYRIQMPIYRGILFYWQSFHTQKNPLATSAYRCQYSQTFLDVATCFVALVFFIISRFTKIRERGHVLYV